MLCLRASFCDGMKWNAEKLTSQLLSSTGGQWRPLNYIVEDLKDQIHVFSCVIATALVRGMVFLSWGRPSSEQQKQVINKTVGFNYDNKYSGASSRSVAKLKDDQELARDGFLINHARLLVGSGRETYEKGKRALQNWRHLELDWTFVDPTTPIEKGRKFCICVKEILPWTMLPLQIVYVDEHKQAVKSPASFGFGSGTLWGHLLAGEERFTIELDSDGKVWYEILSFSKPAHFLSFLGYPYVKLRQRYFAHQSSSAVLRSLSSL